VEVEITGGSTVGSLSDLSDVGTTGGGDGEVLIGDGTDYDSTLLSTAAGSHLKLSDLSSTQYSSLTGTPSIAYNSTIPADNFTSTEVTALRQDELASGATPWTGNNFFDDSDARSAINTDSDHGSTASHNYTSASDLDGTGLTASGGQLDVNESGIQHDNLSGGTDADAHHSKTTSATDLTDVSADSVSDAHHTQPSTGDGLTGSATFAVDSTVARTNAAEIFSDQVRIDGPLANSDNEIGSNNDYVLALGGRPYGVDDSDGTGDDRLGSGLLQTAHGKASDYRIYLQGGHGRVAHAWNAYYDSGASTWRSVVDNEPHSLVGIGNSKPGNVTGGGVTLATADAVNTANADNEQDAEDPITWNVGVHVDVDGKVGIGDITDPANALQVGGDMRATGEVEAFLGSDRRLKTGLDPINSALDKVDELTGYNFDWRNNDSVMPHKRGNRDVGVIAQEVEQILPNAVKEFADGHSKGYKSVSYDKLVPLLIEAIKDLRSQVNNLR
jgi:hypothetical protein